jgi:VIT1/CCC1 family predicted Fe2+/Mn2+ transporter
MPDSDASSPRIIATLAVSVIALFILGLTGAVLGGAKPARPMARVVLGGTAAMGITMLIGKLFGTSIG